MVGLHCLVDVVDDGGHGRHPRHVVAVNIVPHVVRSTFFQTIKEIFRLDEVIGHVEDVYYRNVDVVVFRVVPVRHEPNAVLVHAGMYILVEKGGVEVPTHIFHGGVGEVRHVVGFHHIFFE